MTDCTSGVSGSGVSWGSSWTWAGGENNVKSYPYAGKNFSPRLVSQISSLPTTFSWSYTGNNIRANVAYDLFTSAVSTAPTSGGDYELMIWMTALGNVFPISATGSPVATVTLAGQSWKLYYGLNGSMKVYSFVYANGSLNSFSGDVKAFFNYLVNSWGFPASSQYLTSKLFRSKILPNTDFPLQLSKLVQSLLLVVQLLLPFRNSALRSIKGVDTGQSWCNIVEARLLDIHKRG